MELIETPDFIYTKDVVFLKALQKGNCFAVGSDEIFSQQLKVPKQQKILESHRFWIRKKSPGKDITLNGTNAGILGFVIANIATFEGFHTHRCN